MTLQHKFKELEESGSALLATNFYNYETVTGVVQAAADLDMPLILQASPSTISYLGAEVAAALARTTFKKFGVEGWLHLDHAESYNLIKTCLDAGFDSVMIDASEQSFEDNVSISSRVVELAKPYNANVEAELGYVAKLGQSHDKEGFTHPDEAKKFVERTGVSALAVAIGSAHGFYKKEPNLDLDRLQNIHLSTNAALVLHGGSGIPEKQLQKGIKRGIRKINVATEIKNIFMETLKSEIQKSDNIDLRKVFPPATDEIKKLVKSKLQIIKNA
ncbi:MAG: class II fructose-bisphosphate aldolase [Balneolaceae bacterium]